VTAVADPPGGVKVTDCEPGVKFEPDIVKLVVAAPRATMVGVTPEITGGGGEMVKVKPLDSVLVVSTISARTVADPAVTRAADGTVTVNCVLLDADGVRLNVPAGPMNRTVGTVSPAPSVVKVPLTCSMVLPLPATTPVGFRLLTVGATTLNGNNCVFTSVVPKMNEFEAVGMSEAGMITWAPVVVGMAASERLTAAEPGVIQRKKVETVNPVPVTLSVNVPLPTTRDVTARLFREGVVVPAGRG